MMALGFIFAGLLIVALVGLGAKASGSSAATDPTSTTTTSTGSGTAANVSVNVPGISGSDANQAIADAAARYNVPLDVFYGMFSKETNLGANIATSSAGAVGAFQFEPSTASSYAYPLTNTPNLQEFQAQAQGAAHYLSTIRPGAGCTRSPPTTPGRGTSPPAWGTPQMPFRSGRHWWALVFDRAYELAERLIERLERVIELLERLLERDHVKR